MLERVRTVRRWRLTLGSVLVAVAALALAFAAIRSTMAPYWAATDFMKRNGRGALLSQLRARSAVKVGPDRWQVRYDEAAGSGQREFIITITDEDVKKASFLPW